MDYQDYIFKIFNKKYRGPLFHADVLVGGKYKLALVNERHDYEDGGKEILELCGPLGETFKINSVFGPLMCVNKFKNKVFFYKSYSTESLAEWVIRQQSDGTYKIINKKTRQALYCDDAKDERGNRRVQMGPNSNYENDGSDRWIFQLMKNARKKKKWHNRGWEYESDSSSSDSSSSTTIRNRSKPL